MIKREPSTAKQQRANKCELIFLCSKSPFLSKKGFNYSAETLYLERKTRFELATLSLATRCATAAPLSL